jgi:hypothetical protein
MIGRNVTRILQRLQYYFEGTNHFVACYIYCRLYEKLTLLCLHTYNQQTENRTGKHHVYSGITISVMMYIEKQSPTYRSSS